MRRLMQVWGGGACPRYALNDSKNTIALQVEHCYPPNQTIAIVDTTASNARSSQPRQS